MLQPTGIIAWMPLKGCNITSPTHTGVVGLVEVLIDDETGKPEFRFVNNWPAASNEIDPDIDPTKPRSKNIVVKPIVKVKSRVVR